MDSKHKFLNNLILLSATAMVFTLFCSYPFWFPNLSSNSLKHFGFVSVPNFKSIFNAKCLFILANAIVIFLVGESKYVSSRSSLVSAKKEDRLETNVIGQSAENIDDKYKEEKEIGEEKSSNGDNGDGDNHEYGDCYEQDKEEEEEERAEEEESDLLTKELNKRVEDFIAKVKRQRWLEARVDFGRG